MSVICNICVLLRFLERYTWHAVILSLITATIQGKARLYVCRLTYCRSVD